MAKGRTLLSHEATGLRVMGPVGALAVCQLFLRGSCCRGEALVQEGLVRGVQGGLQLEA